MSKLSLKKTPKVTILSDVVIPVQYGLHEMMDNMVDNSASSLYPPQESFYEMVTPPPPPSPPSQPPVDPPQQEIIDLDNFETPMHVPDYNINASTSNQSIGKSWRKLKEVYRKSSDDEDEDEIEKDEEDEVAEIKAIYRNKIMKNIEEKWKQLEVQKKKELSSSSACTMADSSVSKEIVYLIPEKDWFASVEEQHAQLFLNAQPKLQDQDHEKRVHTTIHLFKSIDFEFPHFRHLDNVKIIEPTKKLLSN
ncbi:hypothetical protein FQR65_LT15391 [Abscondita terminalis]|nr:hypothetical protein FQR65_LT15391 [Abscondita terminalis]